MGYLLWFGLEPDERPFWYPNRQWRLKVKVRFGSQAEIRTDVPAGSAGNTSVLKILVGKPRKGEAALLLVVMQRDDKKAYLTSLRIFSGPRGVARRVAARFLSYQNYCQSYFIEGCAPSCGL
jgi:hypothetical protein